MTTSPEPDAASVRTRPTTDTLGYVVVEWNQASGQPRLMYGADIYDNEVDAWEDAQGEHRVNLENSRREHYGVAKLVLRGRVEGE